MDLSTAHQAHLSLMDRWSTFVSARHTGFGGGKLKAGLGAIVVLTSMTGCRSSMPKFNMFGFKREPSAEAIAGVGPTATYPVSPSAGLTPEAIASTAAGTGAPSGMKPQTGSIASTKSVGQAVPVSTGTPTTNPAAAASNGFYGANGAKPSTAATPASYANATGTSGGFTYGQNPNAGKPAVGTAATAASYSPNKPTAAPSGLPGYAQTGPATPSPSSVPAYSAVPGYPLPGSTNPMATAPATKTAVVPTTVTPTQLASVPPAPQIPATLPTSATAPAFSMPPLASMPPAASSAPTAGGFAMPPGVVAPAASIASLPATPVLPRAIAPSAPSTGGYKPGSTAGAVSYPSGDYPSTGRDTFYR